MGGPTSNHAALSLNGQKSEIRSSNFVKFEVRNVKSEVGSQKSEDSPPSAFYAYAKVRKKAGSTSAFRSTFFTCFRRT